MARFRKERFRAEDLVLCTDPIYEWCCLECYARMSLAKDDPRVGTGWCPRCDRCGGLTAPFDDEAQNPSN